MNNLTGVSLLAIVIGLTTAGTAMAQDVTAQATGPAAGSAAPEAAPATGGVQEIIVTAQRRSQSLQKTPLTIQVLGGEAITRSGITSPDLLSSILPSVVIGTSGPSTSVYIRGVGGFQATAASTPAVPYYIDEIYVARTQSVVSEMYDIDRVEVVKGPQGTLYGRNASGGAINVLTTKPHLGKWEERGSFEVGNYSDKTGELAINAPISANAALRVSGTVVDKGGYTSDGFGSDKHWAARAKLLWEPTNRVSILLNGSYGHIYGGQSAVVALNRDIAGWYPWLGISDPKTQAYAAQTAVVPVPGFVRSVRPSDASQDLSFYNISAQIGVDLGFAKLTIIPAYRHAKMQYTGLFGFLLRNGYDLGSFPTRPLTSRASSVEARLSGDIGRLHYVAGLFADNEDQNEQYTINGGFLESVGQQTLLGTRSYAGFGQATYDLAPKIRLIGGLRYTNDRRELTGESYIISPAIFQGPPPPQAAACSLPAPSQPQCLVDAYTGRRTFRNVSFKGGFEADVLTNSLFYATVSRGFKAGGFNDQSVLGSPGTALPVQPETLTSYETGLKSRLLGNKLQLNVSGYYWNYKNHQEPVLTYTNVPGVTNLVFLNAGASDIYGATADLIARPWTGGTVSGSVEYTHSRYTSFNKVIPTFSYSPQATGCRVASQDPANTTLDCSGFQVSRTPEWSGNVDVNQVIPVGMGNVVADANFNFASARWLGTDFIPVERAKSYGKLDLSLSWQAPARRWSLTGFVRNVTNAAIYTDGAKTPFSSLVYADIQPPRTYGATFGFNF